MKNFMLSLLGCALSFHCFASSVSELDGKTYLTPGSVYVAPNAIYVNMNGNFIQVEGIAVDANGIYIQDYETRPMYCLKCGQYHDSHEKCRNLR
jgi:hypothetical protein